MIDNAGFAIWLITQSTIPVINECIIFIFLKEGLSLGGNMKWTSSERCFSILQTTFFILLPINIITSCQMSCDGWTALDEVYRSHDIHKCHGWQNKGFFHCLVPGSEYSPDIGLSSDGVLGAGVDGVVGLGNDTGLGVGGRLRSDMERGLTSPLDPEGPFDNKLFGVLEGEGGTKGNRGGRTTGGCSLGGSGRFDGSLGRGGWAAPGPSCGGTWPCGCNGCCWGLGRVCRGVVAFAVAGGGPLATPFAAAALFAAAAAAFLLAFSLLLMMTSLSNCTTWRGGFRPFCSGTTVLLLLFL